WRQRQRRVEGHDRALVDPAIDPAQQHVVAKRRLALVIVDLTAAAMTPAHARLGQRQATLTICRRRPELEARARGRLAAAAPEAHADKARQLGPPTGRFTHRQPAQPSTHAPSGAGRGWGAP